jgi:uncharacterized OsmC-like protein
LNDTTSRFSRRHSWQSGDRAGARGGKFAAIEFEASVGKSQTLLGPADLLVTAFAACVLKNVERMAGLQPFRYEGAEIEVTAEREDRPPRISKIRYRLVVTTEEPQRRVDLLHHNIARQGTIYNTLQHAGAVLRRRWRDRGGLASGRVEGIIGRRHRVRHRRSRRVAREDEAREEAVGRPKKARLFNRVQLPVGRPRPARP